MSGFWPSFVTVLTGIIGIAILAVLVSKNANTAGVISSFFSGFSSSISAATGPVTGSSSSFGSNFTVPSFGG